MDCIDPRICTKRLTALTLWSGILLLPLLGLGASDGINSPAFKAVLALHLLVLGAAVAYGVIVLWRLIKTAGAARLLSAASAALVLLVIILQAALPITARDALIHHLAVPKWWTEMNRIQPILWHEWSYYPMLLQLGFTGLLSVGLNYLTPYYHSCCLILLCAHTALFTAVKCKDSDAALLSFIFMLTLPICIKLAGEPLIDLGLALYSAVGVFSLLHWLEEHGEGDYYLIAGGLALGLALSVKFNALLACAVFFPLLLLACRRHRLDSAATLRCLCLSVFLALVVYSPWLVRNFTWTRNPVFPLFKTVFAPPAAGAVPDGPRGLSPLAQRALQYQESWLEVALTPLRIFLFGQDGNPRLFDGRLSPLLLLGLLPLHRLRKRPWALTLFLYSAFYLLFALVLSGARVRYLAPIFAPMVVLASCGAMYCADLVAPRFKAWAVNGCVFIQACLAFFYCGDMLRRSDTLPYLLGAESQEQYLRTHVSEYAMAEYVNSRLPSNSLTYLLATGNRFYYYDRPVISAGHFSGNQIIGWIKQSSDSNDLLLKLRERQISHLLAHAQRTWSLLDNALDERQKQVWSGFVRSHLEPLHAVNGFILWKIEG